MAPNNYWARFQRERISRRRLLVATGAGAAGLAIAAACDDGNGNGNGVTPGTTAGATPTTELGTPVRGGSYVYPTTGDWGTIDPVTSVAFAPGIFPRIYNVLVDRSRRDPSFSYFDLAESMEQPQPEEYIFTIRTGVKIAPNDLGIEERDLDSGDVLAWLQRIDEDPEAVFRTFSDDWLDSFEAPSPQEFVIRTNGPYAYFLQTIGAPLGGTIPPREFFEQGTPIKDNGVGAGPFAIVPGSFSESGEIVVTRNTNYYRTDAQGGALPYLDEIQAVRIDERITRRTAFLDAQIHQYAAEDLEEMEEIRRQLPDITVTEEPSNTFIAFTMNPEKEPWTDERVRKAALHALNRQEYVDRIVGSEGGQINGLVHWSTGDYALPPEELAQLQPFDPAESRRLLQEATGQDTISIPVIYPVSDIQFHDRHLPIFIAQMGEAGFNVQEDPQDFTTWLGNYQSLNYDASLSLNQIYETAEIPLNFHRAAGPQGDRNFAIGIGGLYPEIEEAIRNSHGIVDAAQHIEAVREVQRMLYDRGPAFLPIMTWNSFTLYREFLKNVPRGVGATGLYLWNEVWREG